MISMSMTGFAGRPGMDVLPTCSIERYGMSWRVVSSEAFALLNSVIQTGLCGSIVTFMIAEFVNVGNLKVEMKLFRMKLVGETSNEN